MKKARLIANSIQTVKVLFDKKINTALVIKGLAVSKNAKEAIVNAGGNVD